MPGGRKAGAHDRVVQGRHWPGHRLGVGAQVPRQQEESQDQGAGQVRRGDPRLQGGQWIWQRGDRDQLDSDRSRGFPRSAAWGAA